MGEQGLCLCPSFPKLLGLGLSLLGVKWTSSQKLWELGVEGLTSGLAMCVWLSQSPMSHLSSELTAGHCPGV